MTRDSAKRISPGRAETQTGDGVASPGAFAMPEPAKPAAAKKKEEKKKEEKAEPKKEEPKGDAPASNAAEVSEEQKGEPSTQSDALFIKKPESVLIEAGKCQRCLAGDLHNLLPGKPTVKWFKGKWLELGIKSGLRFQFKETFDKEKNIYSYEMRISKVAIGDRGDYRCEVSSKDKFDSCTFNIDVEVSGTDNGAVLQAFKRTGEGKDDTSGELDFSGLLKKR
ncbi:hypothetical protein JRQ81_005442 [Phrynocephalus forsythii]|uniref:Ig-like domain-containing protein n=1 Tax=Phrynocephalus forsythii TaxID=171643 RepID=A0A9Q1AVR1_9SAUR|nr:hypothetical protein JRQ81_005442 [Phrynocephalus forsythii]